MIFDRNYNIPLEVTPKTFKERILGEHFKVHHLDFEVYDHVEEDGVIKIFPHSESVSRTTTLPITHLTIKPNKDGNGNHIHAFFHIRKIDKGLPLFFILLFAGTLIAGIIGINYENLVKTSTVFIGIGSVGLLLTFLKLNSGYYDYIRKIKAWVETHAM